LFCLHIYTTGGEYGLSLFSKAKASKVAFVQPKMIAVFSPSGADVSKSTMELFKASSQENPTRKHIIVEPPCIGVPRAAYRLLSLEKDKQFERQQTFDSLLLDYERGEYKNLEDYIAVGKDDETDFLIADINQRPDIPTLLKLNDNNTLANIPQLLRARLLLKYHYIWFALQGQLVNPMTLMSLQIADAIVIPFSHNSEKLWAYLSYKRLIEAYGIDEKRIIWISDQDQLQLEGVNVLNRLKDVVAALEFIEPNRGRQGSNEDETFTPTNLPNSKHIGIVNPVDFLNYRSSESSSQLDDSDVHGIMALIDKTKAYLKERHPHDYIQSFVDEKARARIWYTISDYIKEQKNIRFRTDLRRVTAFVQREITELGVLQIALNDPKITSIEINAPAETVVELSGKPVHDKRIIFSDNEHIYRTIDKLLMPLGKTLSANEPIIDANYRGFRVNVILDVSKGGVSANHPIISIRKFPPDVYTDQDCIAYGNISQEIVDFYNDIVPGRPNIVVAGGTNSGKTSTLMRFPLYLDKLDRIITAEDSEEMMLKQKPAYADYPNMAALIVKWHDLKERRIDLPKLVKTTLRQNLDVLLIGEIRDEEQAEQALIAANTGHQVLTSIHANTAPEAAVRMVQLNGDTKTAASRVAQVFDIINFQEYDEETGVRIVTDIAELIGFDGAETPILNPIFKYDYLERKHIRVGNLKN
jgi:pilus assembly protein CpaF